MGNTRPLMKRVCAYVIDLFIVLIIASVISSIPFLNKNIDEYQETYAEYEEKYNEYIEYINLLEETYEDEEINEEEYTRLTETNTYSEITTSKYEDSNISKGEYKEIITEVNDKFDTIAQDYVYILNKKGVSNTIITIVCTLLYFGVLQYFLKGQTIGKRILKLKVVSASDKKINILNYLLRSLIVNDIFLNTIGVIFLILASKSVYINANNIIGTIISLVEAIIIFLVLTRKDGRGLHDLLFNTKVIATDTDEKTTNNSNEVEEPIKETKKIKENKTKSKAKTTTKKKIIDAEYKEEDK